MEFLHGNIVSNKFDIFSLDVVMIKIIAGHEGHSRSVEMPLREFFDLVRNAIFYLKLFDVIFRFFLCYVITTH